MARRPTARRVEEFVFFDVVYEDGTQTSNRKVPGSELDDIDGDLLAKPFFEAQDQKIAEMSGRPRTAIKSVTAWACIAWMSRQARWIGFERKMARPPAAIISRSTALTLQSTAFPASHRARARRASGISSPARARRIISAKLASIRSWAAS